MIQDMSDKFDLYGQAKLKMPPLPPLASEVVFDALKRFVSKRRDELKPTEDLRVSCILPDGRELVAEGFGYLGSSLVLIHCQELGSASVTIAVHPSAVCCKFSIVPREEGKPRRSIGFQTVSTPQAEANPETEETTSPPDPSK